MPDIIYALVLILGVPALLALATGWIQSFAELLWLLTIRPVAVALAVLAILFMASAVLHLLFGLAPVGPLAFSVTLIAVPFAAVPLANYLAHRRRGHDHGALGWKHFIFEAKRLDQRRSYEAPPSAQ